MVPRLLNGDGNVGAEKVLDTADASESCELCKSCLCSVEMLGWWEVPACSDGAIDKSRNCW